MKELQAPHRRRRALGLGVAVVSAVTIVAGCTNGGGFPWRTTTTRATTTPTAPPSTDCHGHNDQDHANNATSTTMGDHGMDHGGGDHHAPGVTFPPCNSTTTRPGQTTTTHGDGHGGHETPERLNHPPTQAQKDWAYKFVRDTNATLKGMTKARARLLGYQDIGDTMHYTNARFRRDGKNFDPSAIESFVFAAGGDNTRIMAAMYNLEENVTINNVQDYAGNWIVYHGHDTLCWPRNQPDSWRITPCSFGEKRIAVLMAHVWIVDDYPDVQKCGVFASIEALGPGSCIPRLVPSQIIAGGEPL